MHFGKDHEDTETRYLYPTGLKLPPVIIQPPPDKVLSGKIRTKEIAKHRLEKYIYIKLSYANYDKMKPSSIKYSL